MEFLIDFITNDNSKISSLIKCCDDENKILRHLAKCYIDGNPQISVFDLLNTVFGTDEYSKGNSTFSTAVNLGNKLNV